MVLPWAAHCLLPRKSALVGRRDVIFLLQDELVPSTGAEPGISLESNRCAALMTKLLAKADLAAQRTFDSLPLVGLQFQSDVLAVVTQNFGKW